MAHYDSWGLHELNLPRGVIAIVLLMSSSSFAAHKQLEVNLTHLQYVGKNTWKCSKLTWVEKDERNGMVVVIRDTQRNRA